MTGFPSLPHGIRRLFRLPQNRGRLLRELDDEMRVHLAMRIDELRAIGMSKADAEAEALRRFGDSDEYRAYAVRRAERHERWRNITEWIDQLSFDLRTAVRSLRRSPGLVTVVVLTLSLGIGATSALFAVVDRLFFKPPAGVADADALRRVYVTSTQTPDRLPQLRAEFSYSVFLALRDELAPTTALTAFTAPDTVRVGRAEAASMLRASYVVGSYFQVLGVQPHLGRLLAAADDQMSTPNFATDALRVE